MSSYVWDKDVLRLWLATNRIYGKRPLSPVSDSTEDSEIPDEMRGDAVKSVTGKVVNEFTFEMLSGCRLVVSYDESGIRSVSVGNSCQKATDVEWTALLQAIFIHGRNSVIREPLSKDTLPPGTPVQRQIPDEMRGDAVKVNNLISDDDLSIMAALIKNNLDWKKLPKLAAIFINRPPVNVYWHELVAMFLQCLEKVVINEALSKDTLPPGTPVQRGKSGPDDQSSWEQVAKVAGLPGMPATGQEGVQPRGTADYVGQSCTHPEHAGFVPSYRRACAEGLNRYGVEEKMPKAATVGGLTSPLGFVRRFFDVDSDRELSISFTTLCELIETRDQEHQSLQSTTASYSLGFSAGCELTKEQTLRSFAKLLWGDDQSGKD